MPNNIKLQSNEPEEMKKEVESIFFLTRNRLENKKFKENLKCSLIGMCKKILQKNSTIQIYDGLDYLVEKLKSIIDEN
jgi:hypothetical protein